MKCLKNKWNCFYINETPLHVASKSNSKEVCELLLNNGANMIAKDKDGVSSKLIKLPFI